MVFIWLFGQMCGSYFIVALVELILYQQTIKYSQSNKLERKVLTFKKVLYERTP